jgi:hypothetical protein
MVGHLVILAGRCEGLVLILPNFPQLGNIWVWSGSQWRWAGCGAQKYSVVERRCKGGFDVANVHESHRIMQVVSPAGVAIVFCSRCGGACTGSTCGSRAAVKLQRQTR